MRLVAIEITLSAEYEIDSGQGKTCRLSEISAVAIEDGIAQAAHPFHMHIAPREDACIPDDPLCAGCATPFVEAGRALLHFIDGATLLFYNAHFSLNPINNALAEAGLTTLEGMPMVDLLTLARERFPEPLCGLDALRQRFAIPLAPQHLCDPMEQVILIAKIYLAMLRYDEKSANNPARAIPSQLASEQIPFVYETLESHHPRGMHATLPSGLHELDMQRGGFHRGDLVVLAGMERAEAAMSIVNPLAFRKFRPCTVAVFSLHMTATTWTEMMLSVASQVPLPIGRSECLSQEQWKRIDSASQQIAESEVHIFDLTPGFIRDINYSCRRIRRETCRLDIVVIDDLQQIFGPEPHEQDYNAIIRKLKAIARQTDAVFILLVDLAPLSTLSDGASNIDQRNVHDAIGQAAGVVLYSRRNSSGNREITVSRM